MLATYPAIIAIKGLTYLILNVNQSLGNGPYRTNRFRGSFTNLLRQRKSKASTFPCLEGSHSFISITLTVVDSTPFYTPHTYDQRFISEYVRLARSVVAAGFSLTLPGHSGLCRTCGTPFDPEGIVVTSHGQLYSCWDSAGQAGMSIGDVISGFDTSKEQSWVQCGYSGKESDLHQRLALEIVKILAEG